MWRASPPPIIIGGQGKTRTPALAARFATEFNVAFQPRDVVKRQYSRVDRACLEIDRDPASITRSVGLVLCCGRDDNEFRRRAAAIGRDTDHQVIETGVWYKAKAIHERGSAIVVNIDALHQNRPVRFSRRW